MEILIITNGKTKETKVIKQEDISKLIESLNVGDTVIVHKDEVTEL